VRDARDLMQQAGLHVEDEAADLITVREVRAGHDAEHSLAGVLVDVGERFNRPRRAQPGVVLDFALERVVGEPQQVAVGVMDHHDFPGAEPALADRE
jgi:hypothetical protein